MTIHAIDATSPLWEALAAYADTCSWDACQRMAAFMRSGGFRDGETVLAAEENGVFMGFCALMRPETEYSPLLKWLFVEEKYRGQRLSEQLIDAVGGYAKALGYARLFLATWHTGLYEKYGFVKIGEKEMRPGYSESVYEKAL